MLEFLIAFGAGLISFLSPCVLPLIPGYISYISGSSFNELIKKKNINFHARYSAKERIYLYIIQNRFSPSIVNNDREWHIRNKLDVNLIKKGSKKLIGTHDFSTFRSSNCGAKSPIRTINEIIVSKSKNQIKLKFKSKSFLKNQVRSMVGCLKYLGEKKWSLKKFENVIKMKDRKKVAPPAPACGLYLEKVIY